MFVDLCDCYFDIHALILLEILAESGPNFSFYVNSAGLPGDHKLKPNQSRDDIVYNQIGKLHASMPKPLKGTLLKDHFKFHQRMRLMMLSGLLAFSLVVSGCTRTPKPVPSQVMPTITKEADDPSPQVVAVDPGVSGTITISSIQGAGHVSPFENQQVEGIHGIVTAIRADGFYMQSLVPDNDPATSEGIYVLQGLIPSVRSGDEVLVNGLVKEGCSTVIRSTI